MLSLSSSSSSSSSLFSSLEPYTPPSSSTRAASPVDPVDPAHSHFHLHPSRSHSRHDLHSATLVKEDLELARGDSPLLGWEGDFDTSNPLLFPGEGYERDLPVGADNRISITAADLQAHPLALRHHRASHIHNLSISGSLHSLQSIQSIAPSTSTSVLPSTAEDEEPTLGGGSASLPSTTTTTTTSMMTTIPPPASSPSPLASQPFSPSPLPLTHSNSHSRNHSRNPSQELPLPLPPSVIPQLQKRKRATLSRTPSLGLGSQQPATPEYQSVPASPHCIPLPSSPVRSSASTGIGEGGAYHAPGASIGSISSIGTISELVGAGTFGYDVFSALTTVGGASASARASPCLTPSSPSRSGSSSNLATLNHAHQHSRGNSLSPSISASASMHSLSSSSQSVRNAVYISDESGLEVLDYTLSSPRGSVVDLGLGLGEGIEGILGEEGEEGEEGNTKTIYVPNPDRERDSGHAHLRIGSAFLGPDVLGRLTGGEGEGHEMSADRPMSSLYIGPGLTTTQVSSPETSPYAPSFAFSARESSGSSGSSGEVGGGDVIEKEKEKEKKLRSRWSTSSSMIEFPSVPPSTPAFGASTQLQLPLPPAPKPSEEPSEYPMPLNRAPTMSVQLASGKDKGNRRSRRSSLVPFVGGLREREEEEKEEKGRKAFKKAMLKLQGQDGVGITPPPPRKRASSSFGRTEGTFISAAIAEAVREYKDVVVAYPSPPEQTVSKRKRLASFISRLSLNPAASNPNMRSAVQLESVPATPPTPDFPSIPSSRNSPSSSSPPPPPVPRKSFSTSTSTSPLGSPSKPSFDRLPSLNPLYSPTSPTFPPGTGTGSSTPMSPVSVSSEATAMPAGMSPRPSGEGPIVTGTGTGVYSGEREEGDKGGEGGRHIHGNSQGEVEGGNEDENGGVSGREQGQASSPAPTSTSPSSTTSSPWSPPTSTRPPFPPLSTMPPMSAHHSSSGLTSPPRSPTKMRFAVNGTQREVEIPPVPLGPAPVPPSTTTPVGLLASPVGHEFGMLAPQGEFSSQSREQYTPPPSGVHIKISSDSPFPSHTNANGTGIGNGNKTPTKKKKFSTMLGLRGSRSESVLRLDKSSTSANGGGGDKGLGGVRRSPPPASPMVQYAQSGSKSAMSSPLGSPMLSPPPTAAAGQFMNRSPLASSFVPSQIGQEQGLLSPPPPLPASSFSPASPTLTPSMPTGATHPMFLTTPSLTPTTTTTGMTPMSSKSRPKSAAGGLRERFRAWAKSGPSESPGVVSVAGEESRTGGGNGGWGGEVPPPVPPKEGVVGRERGVAF